MKQTIFCQELRTFSMLSDKWAGTRRPRAYPLVSYYSKITILDRWRWMWMDESTNGHFIFLDTFSKLTPEQNSVRWFDYYIAWIYFCHRIKCTIVLAEDFPWSLLSFIDCSSLKIRSNQELISPRGAGAEERWGSPIIINQPAWSAFNSNLHNGPGYQNNEHEVCVKLVLGSGWNWVILDVFLQWLCQRMRTPKEIAFEWRWRRVVRGNGGRGPGYQICSAQLKRVTTWH